MDWLIWVIIAVVVIALIALLVTMAGRKKKERNREHAGELRQQAAARAPEVKEREARARETEAEAAAARAEADRKQAEADRLEAQAQDRHQAAGEVRDEHHEHLRKADELDPDVNTKRDDYQGPETSSPESTGPGTGVGNGAGTHEGGSHAVGTGSEHLAEHEQTTITHPDGTTEKVDGSTPVQDVERGDGRV
jgi:FtsZ-interacting cell division protein ZipA